MIEYANAIWAVIGFGLDLAAAIVIASLAVWLATHRSPFGASSMPIAIALFVTAGWCVADAAAVAGAGWASRIESARNLAWLIVIYNLFASEGGRFVLAPIRPVIYALAFVEFVHVAVDLATAGGVGMTGPDITFNFSILLRLLVMVGGLVLVHNLYAGAQREARNGLRWPAIGLAILWAFDLNFYTVAYLSGRWPMEIGALRGGAVLALAACTAIGAARNREELRVKPSRTVTFQTFSLLVIGFYLVAMIGIGQWLSYAGGDFARVMALAFLTLASAVAIIVLPSRRARSWLKVMLAKHFFQHRYDYRQEWLRFTRTIGSGGEQALPLGERIVQAVGDVTTSSAGLLLTPGEHGDLTLAARWNWRDAQVPALAYPQQSLAPFESLSFIVDLDDQRSAAAKAATAIDVPHWLLAETRAWALVPLVHYERLVGLVVLARPPIARKFDWEDFDLLRVIGQQLASYLAENASQEALAESSRFEDFHRRIAFVMHDIKNLASQFSLLARNAELHAEKPEFRADMLLTLRNSSDKLNALLARLSRYGNGAVDSLGAVDAADVVRTVINRFRDFSQVVLTESQDIVVTGNRHSLEQVLVHLVQNALDASDPGSPVVIALNSNGLSAQFEVLDSGCGMSADFVRNRLFKPFMSTKNGGFGLGAFEARELVRAMKGRLDVESREGLGSRFIVRLPLAAATDFYQSIGVKDQKVLSI